MRDIEEQLSRWLRYSAGPVALATVVSTWGSSPRGVGSKMAVSSDGQIAGSVSGGCVEAAVVQSAEQVIATGKPELLHFGVADQTAWDVGLACGGTITVFVELLDKQLFQAYLDLVKRGTVGCVITVIDSPLDLLGRHLVIDDGALVHGNINDGLNSAAIGLAVATTTSAQHQLAPDVRIFIEVIIPPPTLVMVGGVHISIALTSLAKLLGYETIVIEPRRSFGNAERFPHADSIITKWPDAAFAEINITRNSAVAILTHDPKIDDPALNAVLKSDAFYIGALGSKNTQVRRNERLQLMGFEKADIDRIHGPIGLDISAQNPEEIALSIMAEITAARHSINQVSTSPLTNRVD